MTILNPENANTKIVNSTLSGSFYLDKDGNRHALSEQGDYLDLINKLKENPVPDVVAPMETITAKTVGMNQGAGLGNPVATRICGSIVRAYPYETYHDRYLRECMQTVTQYILSRLAKRKTLFQGIQQYKDHVDGQVPA